MTINKGNYELRLSTKFGIKSKHDSFIGLNKEVKHTCPNCGKQEAFTPIAVLGKTELLCSDCDLLSDLVKRQKAQEIEFKELLQELVPYIECTHYEGASKLGKFQCLKCGSVISKLPRGVITSATECTSCSEKGGKKTKPKEKENKNKWKHHPAVFENKNPISKALLLKWLGNKVKAGSIKPYSINEAPLTTYKVSGKAYGYWPDFIINENIVVEARGAYWLWRFWKIVTEKAKSCVKQGYKFKLLVYTNRGTIVELPTDWYTKPKNQIEHLLACDKNTTKLTILSLDPGVTNSAWAVSTYDKSKGEYTLIASGKVQNAITDLTFDLAQQLNKYATEIQNLVVKYNVNCLGMERFQARGMKGTTIELVNIMIGTTITQALTNFNILLFRVIPASQWKNAWNRLESLEDYYAKAPCTPHQADAIGIGIYCLSEWLAFPLNKVINTKYIKKLCARIEETNTLS